MYPRQVQPGELFVVDVENATLRVGDQAAVELHLACLHGWDPARRVVFEGHPTVMAFNMYDHQITEHPGDISATACPMMEVTRYYRVMSDGLAANEDRKWSRGDRERRAKAG